MSLCKILALLLVAHTLSLGGSSQVKLNNGGYEDIVFAINPGTQEDTRIIDSIKAMVKEATSYLFHATKNRLFITSVKILIPITWSKKGYSKVKTETYNKADVIIATPHLKNGDDPYTLQYGLCGDNGRYIHFTPDFLVDDKLIAIYGPRGRVFVHEWAHYRWGVYDEYNTEVPYYISNKPAIESTRCPAELTGVYRKENCNGNGDECACNPDPDTGLYGKSCVFLPDKNQASPASIMYLQALNEVTEFCNASNHNTEAPNLQNRMCNYRSTWDVIMNSSDINSTPPTTNITLPEPIVTVLQASDRVVTLVLDVSGSMGSYNRIGRLCQAAEVFLVQIIEQGSHVGIVRFETSATLVSPLRQIITDQNRADLKKLLPTVASGGTNICAGILKGIEVNKQKDKSSYGTEIVLLSDGEDNDPTFPSACYADIINSGAIIHVIALGPNAAQQLENITRLTGGLQFFATDTLDANGLIDAFSAMQAGTGYEADQTVQLESTGATLAKSQCLNGTVFIDKTIGNDTFFLVTWQTAVPSIELQDPTGVIYTTSSFSTDTTTKSHRLQIPGTAKTGAWHYSLCSTVTASQAVGITVTSKAANESVPPITVSAHMDTDTNAYPKPMVVYAAVRQGLLPVINANVTAIIEPTTGPTISFELLDNGAGPDIIKNDGIYSKYFTSFTVNGRYNLKVNVTSNDNKGRLVLPQNRALYMPGYVENGAVIMNPSRPVADEEELNLGSFSRSASGGSFSVTNVPSGPLKDIYKPEKITDLVAKIAEDKIVLSWTATGDDLDQGNATSYDLRLSTNPRDLRDNFFSSVLVDVSSVKPLPAGYSETFTFKPENITIQNGTILYFALIAVDEVDQKSDMSNIAQAALFIPPTPEPTTPAPTEVPRPVPTEVPTGAPTNALEKDNINVTVVTIIVCVAAVVITLIIGITVCIVCRLKN